MSAATLKHITTKSLSVDNKLTAAIRAEVFHAQFMYEFANDEDITLADKLWEFMNRKGWNRNKLAEKACLETNECYRVLNGAIGFVNNITHPTPS